MQTVFFQMAVKLYKDAIDAFTCSIGLEYIHNPPNEFS